MDFIRIQFRTTWPTISSVSDFNSVLATGNEENIIIPFSKFLIKLTLDFAFLQWCSLILLFVHFILGSFPNLFVPSFTYSGITVVSQDLKPKISPSDRSFWVWRDILRASKLNRLQWFHCEFPSIHQSICISISYSMHSSTFSHSPMKMTVISAPISLFIQCPLTSFSSVFIFIHHPVLHPY